ncbi:MAG: methyltransferase domain-containing protein [bacterium]
MRKELLGILACPNCKGNSLNLQAYKGQGDEILDGEINCEDCQDNFPIIDSIPIMLPRVLREENKSKQNEVVQKKRQMAYFDEKGMSDLEVNRPRGLGKLYNFLIEYKLRTVIKLLGCSLKKTRILNICCGSGMEAEFLSGQGAKIIGLDISLEAAKGAKKRATIYGFDLDLIVGDAESLPFIPRCFDYGFAHDGLHHLPHPEKGISELSRVADKGVFFIEPASALLTKLACLLGVAKKREPSGNLVYRFKKEELKRLLKNLGFSHILFKRYLMYYPHNPSKGFSIFEYQILMFTMRIIFYSINKVFGQWGNRLSVVAKR